MFNSINHKRAEEIRKTNIPVYINTVLADEEGKLLLSEHILKGFPVIIVAKIKDQKRSLHIETLF